MRSGTGTKSGEPSLVTFSTKLDDGLLVLAVVPRGQRVWARVVVRLARETTSTDNAARDGFHGWFGSIMEVAHQESRHSCRD